MGKFSKTKSEYFPKFEIAYLDFVACGEQTEIVIEVANYVYARSGLWLPLKFGTKDALADYRLVRTIMEGIVIGVAIIMLAALFYLLVIMKDKLITVALILATILTLIYQITKGERLIILMFPDVSMGTIVKLQYMVLYLLPLCMLIFLIRMKNIKKIGIISKSLIVMSVGISVVTIFVPVSIFTQFAYFGYFVTFSIIADVFFLCIFDAIKGDMKSEVVLYALLSIGVTTAHDLLITNNIIGGKMDILSMGFLIAILIFSILVIAEIQNKFEKAELVDVYEQGYLNSQIKSHFIFNSLNSITNKIKTNADEAEELAVTFAAYLRATIDWHNLSVTIPFAKELEITENYVFIQQNRFKDIEFEFEIEEGFNADVPPLTLQPLVENAIEHGLKPQKYKGIVVIKAYTKENQKYLEVFNNGVGIDSDKLDELNLEMSKDYIKPKLNDRIGIKNINWRIKELTNNPLEINSSENGVSIIIKL